MSRYRISGVIVEWQGEALALPEIFAGNKCIIMSPYPRYENNIQIYESSKKNYRMRNMNYILYSQDKDKFFLKLFHQKFINISRFSCFIIC